MFEVKFSPGIARLRELMQANVKSAEELNVLLDRLLGSHLSDDQLFASLLFYTKQELWKDSCSMYRALYSPVTLVTADMFVQLIERLQLTDMYSKICHLPSPVCIHLLSMLLDTCDINAGNVAILEGIARTLIDSYSNRDSVSVLVLHNLITKARLPLPLLLDSLYWMTDDGDVSVVVSPLVTQFINCSVRCSVHRAATAHKGCSVGSVELDRSMAILECIEVISKQHGREPTMDIKPLVTDMVNEISDDMGSDVTTLCRTCHRLRRRLNGFCSAFPQTRKSDVQWVENALSAAEERLLHHDLFMSTIVNKAATTNDLSSIQLIATQILSYLTNASVRDLLLTHYQTMRWTEEQVQCLLNTLNSLSPSSDVGKDVSLHLQMMTVDGLSKLSARSRLLTFEYLRPFSSCFSDVQCQAKTNLVLNKVRPHSSDVQASCTLSVLLSISPYDVLKRITDQVLISQAALGAAMAKVYVSVLNNSKLPKHVYELHAGAMNLNDEQWDNILSKCLLYFPLHGSPATNHLLTQCMDKITLSSPSLLDMLANIEVVLTSDPDSIDPVWLSAISLFSLSILDNELSFSGPPCSLKIGQAMRLLSAELMTTAIEGVDKPVLNAVLQSLHSNTIEHLRADKSVQHLFLH